MAKTLSLGLVIRAVGFSAATHEIGTVNSRLQAIGEVIEKSKAAVKNAGTEMIDSFAKQKLVVEKAREELDQYQKKTTEMGRRLAEHKNFQAEATAALAAYQAELKNQTSPATDAQRLKLQLLGEQAKGADADFRKLTREFEKTRDKSKDLKQAFQDKVGVLDRLRDKLRESGVETSKLDEHRRRLKATLESEQQTVERLTRRYQQLGAAQEANAKARADMNSRAGDVVAAYGMGRMLAAPIGAHVRQDDALNALQVAMMDKDGKVPKSYETLKKQAVELGNVLPGTTADFAGTARALMEQGVAIDSVLNGGLKAAANMSVVLRIPADQAGEMAAKLREAYKLSDSELTKMADSMQRAKFAFGMKPSDLMAASSYQAPMLNQLGISGLANTNKMLAIQGMAANVGLEGSSFGTNFSMMLTRLAKGPEAIEAAKKGMKAEARHILEKLNIKFDFFDKKGNFAGLDHMVKELEKLKTIKNKLGDKAALEVAEAMFGAEAGRPAMILAEQGMKGFEEAQKKMADQASLDDRIKKTLESTRNTWDSLTGSVENFGAAAAGPAVLALHPLINLLNTGAGALTSFAEKHPTAVKWIGIAAMSLIGGAVALLSFGTALSVARFAWTGAKLLPGMMSLGSGAAWLGRILAGGLTSGLRIAAQAIFFVGRALMANPIGLAIMVIAGAAYLIYRNWDRIKPWFQGLWRGVVSIFNSAVAWFKGLPARFGEIGRNLIDGLINGVMGKINAAREAIVGIGSKIKGWFSETLGIKSPSRVFVGFGNNIGEGAALGIGGSVSRVKNAVGKLSGAAMSGVSAASSALNAMSGGGAAAGGAGKLEITYSPTVHVQGGGSDVAGQVKRGLDMSLHELEQMIQRVTQQQSRRAYG